LGSIAAGARPRLDDAGKLNAKIISFTDKDTADRFSDVPSG